MKNKQYDIYQRDGQNLIKIYEGDIQEIRYKKYEEIKNTGYELIFFKGAFIVFKRQKGTEIPKIID